MVKEGRQQCKVPRKGAKGEMGLGGNTLVLQTLEGAESGQGWKNPCETRGALAFSVLSRKEEGVGRAAGETGGPLNVGGGETACRRFRTGLKNPAVEKGSRKLRNEKKSRAEVGDPKS